MKNNNLLRKYIIIVTIIVLILFLRVLPHGTIKNGMVAAIGSGVILLLGIGFYFVIMRLKSRKNLSEK